jgi:iron complex transport system ATP-binding protein
VGANGSGKTTLLRIASMYEHPSTGDVQVLGERLGHTDVRVLRRRIGYMSPSLAAQLRQELRCLDVVMTAKYAALEPWWHRYTSADEARALECLQRMRVGHLAERSMSTTSSGEQQRVLLARTLMNDPAVLLLDEPSARLDLGGREQLVEALAELTTDPAAPPLILVTHHLDEVPPGMTHVLMLRDGQVVAAGPVDTTLTAANLSEAFSMELVLERREDGRFNAWAPRAPATAPARTRSGRPAPVP